MALMTEEQRRKLIENGRERDRPGYDPLPIVRFFTPDANAVWLIIDADPDEPDRLFGLCDLGLGSPELGYVSLSELEALRGPLGLPVERDRHFEPDKPLSEYAADARAKGRIDV